MRDPEFLDDRDFLGDEDDAELEPRGRDIWQRLSQLMVACLFVLVLAGILRIFWPEIQRHQELSAEAQRLESMRDARLERVAELRRQHEWMLTDREYLESVARDRLDLAYENETVVRIDRESAALALAAKRQRQREDAEAEAAAAASDAESADPDAGSATEAAEPEAAAEARPPIRASVVELPSEG